MTRTDNKTKNRIPVIDLLKLTAMLFICIPHCLQRWGSPNYTATLGFSLFYSVALPLFFFSSGLLIKRATSIKELVIYVIKTICVYLIPAYFFSCLSIWTLPRFTLLEKDFGYWMNEMYLRTDTFYWYFLVAAFINVFIAIAYYFIALIKKDGLRWDMLKSSILIILSSAYLLIFLYIYNRDDLGPGCLSANMVLYYFPLTLFAFIFNTFKPYLSHLSKVKILKGIGALVALAIYVPILIVYRNWLPNLSGSFMIIATLWLGSLSGTLLYYYGLAYLSKFIIAQKISYFGRFSGPFYLVHVYLVRLFATYITRPTLFDSPTIMFVTFLTIIFTVGSLFITIILCFIPYTDFFLFLNYKRLKDMLYPRRWIKNLRAAK
ncbi:MAG: Acyltransferase family protein [Tenericutes bacterium ADurb.Bin239]|nr:MAG: Acyltransferase family protein [Tenericutes bacterium ADurb.Bin239]